MATDRTKAIGPEDYEDHAGILRYLETVETSERQTHDALCVEALLHVYFYLGRQWLTYDRVLRAHRPLALREGTMPQPVTNKFAVGADAIASALLAYQTSLAYHPATDQPEDVAAANVADQVLEIIKHEVGVRELNQLRAKWVTLTGDCFRVTQYVPDLMGPQTMVQHERCQSCLAVSDPQTLMEANGVCPSCGAQGPYLPAENEQGQPVGDLIPKGRMDSELHSRFTVWADSSAPSLEQSPYVIIDERRPLDWVARTYGQETADQVEVEVSRPSTSWMTDALAHSAGLSLWSAGGSTVLPMVRLRRLWLRPTPRFPDGLYAEVLGQTVADSRPWPYHDREGRPVLNITHTRYDTVPGRLWGKTRASDVIEKQRQRNKIEAVMQLIERRTGTSSLLVPHGADVSRVSGEPGFILRYNAMAGVPPPQRMEGSPPQPYWIQRLAQIDNEMDSLWGTFDVGRGEAPKGVSSYAGMSLLDERSRQAKSAVLMNWGLEEEAWARLSLDIWREHADDERTLATGEGAWAVRAFSKADLTGGVDVSIDLGMNRPYTQIGRRAAVEQAIRLALISPQDPAERYRALQILGVPEIMADYKRERADASRENDLLLHGEPVRDPLPWENHPVHLEVHQMILTGERFDSLPPEAQQAAQNHTQWHYIQMQQQAAQRPMGPGQIAPGPNQGQGGTAEENAGGPDQAQQDQEAQMASPDDFSGGGQPQMAGVME